MRRNFHATDKVAVLYSITGVITALFLMIIVIGAVRAHRHPERYGPRNVMGRSRQSRAKGIARAMLETIPIVKFGEKDEPKATETSRDIEMGAAGPTNDHSPPKLVASTIPNSESEAKEGVREGASNEGADLVTTVTASGATDAMHSHVDGETNADNGLACSVCTDDFVKGQNIRVLPCNHKFHPECIDPWLLNVSGTCPLWYAIPHSRDPHYTNHLLLQSCGPPTYNDKYRYSDRRHRDPRRPTSHSHPLGYFAH